MRFSFVLQFYGILAGFFFCYLPWNLIFYSYKSYYKRHRKTITQTRKKNIVATLSIKVCICLCFFFPGFLATIEGRRQVLRYCWQNMIVSLLFFYLTSSKIYKKLTTNVNIRSIRNADMQFHTFCFRFCFSGSLFGEQFKADL